MCVIIQTLNIKILHFPQDDNGLLVFKICVFCVLRGPKIFSITPNNWTIGPLTTNRTIS